MHTSPFICSWLLFLWLVFRPVSCPQVLRLASNVPGVHGQKITTKLAGKINHRFDFILCYLELLGYENLAVFNFCGFEIQSLHGFHYLHPDYY